MHSNYNKFEKDIVNSQNKSKDAVGITVDEFYDYNNIRDDQRYNMPDKSYLLFYHNYGNNNTDQGFKDIIEKYSVDEKSLPVYLVPLDEYDITRIEFIVRRDNEYSVEEDWYLPENVEYMPYKVE